MIQQFRNIDHVPNLRKHFLQSCTSETYSLANRIGFAERYQKFITKGDFNWQLSKAGDSYALDLSNNLGMYTVAVLRNLPLKQLNLANSSVNELTGLEKVPLEILDISNTNVVDLLPLKNAPLRELNIDGTSIRNISFLQTLPIEVLQLNNKRHDYRVFLSMKELKKLTVYMNTFTDPEIREMKSHLDVIIK